MVKLPDITKFDPDLTAKVMGILRPLLKAYHRSEVRGLENISAGRRAGGGQPLRRHVPDGRADLSARLLRKFGYDRPVYTLSHDILFMGPTGDFFRRTGYILASHENADKALRSGGLVVVFPGGDYDVYRPSRRTRSTSTAARVT